MTDPAEVSAASVEQDAQIRTIAAQIAGGGATVPQFLKGVVTAVNPTASPPNFAAQLGGDTTTTVSDIVHLDSYSPVVGDTVLIVKNGSEIFGLGQINDTGSGSANGWTQMTLGSGFSHNGNANGNAEFRRVVDNGDLKLQLRGGVAISGTQITVCVLPVGFRPTVKRSLLVARNIDGGSVVAQIDVYTDGTVMLIGATTGVTGVSSSGGGGSTSSVDPNDNTTGVSNSYDGGIDGSGRARTSGPTIIVNNGDTTHQHLFSHDHGVTGSHSHTTPNHTHTMTAVAHPTWLSFNGVEFYL
ncbi:hypothetical protein [Rhodococcus sp. 11-3]|uniref:hypothetical protein n=1 Tax=Rhodococcus sp. 11-3 TaxID=2854796 RepID=UPI00203FD7B3|nr:hypothetical protein [Rhodococcus sp. 11-3]USC17045.1 hypothetical protein KZJ41_09335 [Rhodococcus sp. 11-3]